VPTYLVERYWPVRHRAAPRCSREAVARFAMGWNYRSKYVDNAQFNPHLVPSASLSEAEKNADREMAVKAARLFLALASIIHVDRSLAEGFCGAV
jgi:RyR domain-containing protein